MEYNDYYEQDFQGETLVTLDYADPEPSLYKVSRGKPRHSQSGQMPKLRAARQNYSRPYQERHENNFDDFRDDVVSGEISSRRSVRGDRSVSSRQRNSGRTLGSQSASQRMRKNSQRSSTSSRKTSKKTVDLTRPDSDSSFSLFATLVVQHIEPKLKGNIYTLDGGDMSYLEAIIPDTLRLPFVEAVRIRSQCLPMEVSGDETDLETAVRNCAKLGLGYTDENNFLLGGGQKIRGGKIVMRLVDKNSASSEEEDNNRTPPISEEEALAQVEAAYGRRDREKTSNQTPAGSEAEKPRVPWEEDEDEAKSEPSNKSKTPENATTKNAPQKQVISEEEARAKIAAAYKKRGINKKSSKTKQKHYDHPSSNVEWSPKAALTAGLMKSNNRISHENEEGYQPPVEIIDDASSVAMSSLGGSVNSSSRQSIASSSRKSLASSRKSSSKLSKPNAATRNLSNASLLGESEILNKEVLLADTIDEETQVREPHFDMSVKKIEQAEARAKERRKKNKRQSRKKRTQSCVTDTISVNASPSDLDMTVAAFEHEWRDGLWDIFAHGIFHPHLILAFVAPIFALGQVMTRLKLNWIGASRTEAETYEIFQKLGTLVGCLLAINIVTISLCVFLFHVISGVVELLLFVCVMANLWFYGFCVFTTGNTRKYLRTIYNINDTAESDYLLAAFYMPFTITQMARHTADYNTLQARICTPSGLPNEADFSFIANVGTFGSYGSYASFGDEEVSVTASIASRYTGSVSASVGGSTHYDGSVTSSYA